jgi:L-ascorbate metabolism protein UlaG (beta-lactamase superfamily)
MPTRRALLRMLASFVAVGAAGGVYAAWRRSSNPYYAGPASDHFDGVHFFNPGGRRNNGILGTLRWRATRRPEPWPDLDPVARPTDKPPRRVEGEALRVSFIGHASLLAQTSGLNILFDPVWAERASPFRFAGPKRVNPPGIAFADLPPIDVVIVSHNHYDHMDLATLKALHERFAPRVVTPLGNDAILRGADAGMRIEALDWNAAATLSDRVRLRLAPTHHWSARGLLDQRMALWATFAIEAPGGVALLVGDSGFNGGAYYRAIAERFSPLRFAYLPIGAYEPQWFMSSQHQNPDEAVRAHLILRSACTLAHHWGTFPLADEGFQAPLTALEAALGAHGVSPDAFRALAPGGVWDVPALASS